MISFIQLTNQPIIIISTMLTTLTFLFTANAAFLLGFKLQPENLAFKATVAPVGVTLNEGVSSPTKPSVSLNLSFEIHPQAILDLFETVTTECQQIYKVYEPVAIDLLNTASDQLARAYEKYQPIAWELFDETIRPLALDLLDIISTEFQQFYGFFTEDVSVPYDAATIGNQSFVICRQASCSCSTNGEDESSSHQQCHQSNKRRQIGHYAEIQVSHAPLSSIATNLSK
ncbi:unnamed protein product [Cylindrotheca closterium]|uniref:Uncharacterized protein n=1 Tax=Cylindrotheca closterium TaxID=2856 RepID=A0AAD2FZM0_9STRA|nr:unnamed protein product [Cylindrotheca closterium]